MYIRKQINRSKRYFNYDENTTLNKVNKTVKNSIYKNYSISNIQENFLANKTIVNNNITRKTIPNFIQEDHYFYFHKTVNASSASTVDLSNYYNKTYIDAFMSSFQNLMTRSDQRLRLIQASINSTPGDQY